MTGRWSGSPEPVPNHIILNNKVEGMMWDFARLTAPQRMDIPVGTAEPVDVAARFDDDPDCYGWSNESYFSEPIWKNPRWRLAPGRYLVHVVARSQGETAEKTFRLVTDVRRTDFRLEPAMVTDMAR